MSEKTQQTMQRLIDWRQRHISDRQFTLILSFSVGFFAAVAAYVLHRMINLIEDLLTDGFTASSINWLYLVFPVVGIFFTSLFVRYVVRDNISHGTTMKSADSLLIDLRQHPKRYVHFSVFGKKDK